MSFTITQEADRRIIVGSLGGDFDIFREIYAYINVLKTALDRMDGPAIYISDVHNYEINFGDLTSALGTLTRGDLTVLKHPRLHKTIVITSNGMIRLGVNALGQKQYGSIRASVVATMQEALAQASKDLINVREIFP